MFASIKRRIREIQTIGTLCKAAEKHARASGQQQPGAEHFMLAALELPDGSARRVFERVGADPQEFGKAIEQQYRDALHAVGLDLPALDEPEQAQAFAEASGVYRAQPSGQAVMQRMAEQRTSGAPLSGAHVVLAVASSEHGVAPRALRSMGVNREHLLSAARAEIAAI